MMDSVEERPRSGRWLRRLAVGSLLCGVGLVCYFFTDLTVHAHHRKQWMHHIEAAMMKMRLMTFLTPQDGMTALDGMEAVFDAWAKKHGKVYASDTEKEKRFMTFVENMERIRKHNGDGMLSASPAEMKMRINQFGDLTADEFKERHASCIMSRTKKWEGATYLGRHKYSGAELPKSVDWVDKGAVTEVKNQEECGSCWSFSTTGALEGAFEIATGKLVELSEQQFVDCAGGKWGNMGCNGGLMDSAFEYAESFGICTEESYPYKAEEKKCHYPKCTIGMEKGTVKGFKDVDHDEDALKEAISKGPVSIAIEADKTVFQFYSGGVLKGHECGERVDHGVLAVGYGELDGVKYWKVKNSWGDSWGENGYILLERGRKSLEEGECGILTGPSFPELHKKDEIPQPVASAAPFLGHYEHPPCQKGEIQARVRGDKQGSLCAPFCSESVACPSDPPPDTTAKPMCVLQDQRTAKSYCALICEKDQQCGPGAVCSLIQDHFGVCLFPDQADDAALLSVQSDFLKPESVVV